MSLLSLGLLLLIWGGVFFSAQWAELIKKLSPGCFFHQITGLKCLGCGGTRASLLLLEGNVVEACKMNLFWLPSGLILLLLYLDGWMMALRPLSPRPFWTKTKILLFKLYALFAVIFLLARNIADF